MPVENTVKFTPRKFYLTDEMDEYIEFFLEELVAQYINDKQMLESKEFETVYEAFDPRAILDLTEWLNAGNKSSYAIKLENALEEIGA